MTMATKKELLHKINLLETEIMNYKKILEISDKAIACLMEDRNNLEDLYYAEKKKTKPL